MSRYEAYSKDSFVTHLCHTNVYYEPFTGPAVTYDAAHPDHYFVCYSTMEGERNPFWREAIRQGVCATTRLYGKRQRLTRLGGVFEQVWDETSHPGQYRLFRLSGDFVTPQMATSPDYWGDPRYQVLSSGPEVEAADNCAKKKFLARAIERTADFRSGTFLGEMREALRMIKSPLLGFRRALAGYIGKAKKPYHRLTKRNFKNRSKDVADLWLEASFGWKPFVSDLTEAVDAFVNLGLKPRSVRVKASCESGRKAVYWNGNAVPMGNSLFYYNIKQEGYAIVTYLGAVGDQLAAEKYTLSLANFGLTLDQFVPTLYQLTPWSFLVDYFVNLDDIIEAWSYRRENLRWVQKTVHRINERVLIPVECTSVPYYPVKTWRPPEWKSENRIVLREEFLGSLVPSLVYRLPIDPIKGANLLALAVSNAGSLERIGKAVYEQLRRK